MNDANKIEQLTKELDQYKQENEELRNQIIYLEEYIKTFKTILQERIG